MGEEGKGEAHHHHITIAITITITLAPLALPTKPYRLDASLVY